MLCQVQGAQLHFSHAWPGSYRQAGETEAQSSLGFWSEGSDMGFKAYSRGLESRNIGESDQIGLDGVQGAYVGL